MESIPSFTQIKRITWLSQQTVGMHLASFGIDSTSWLSVWPDLKRPRLHSEGIEVRYIFHLPAFSHCERKMHLVNALAKTLVSYPYILLCM